MLNVDTRKIINSARDILVGKVPDPKAQVEQITFAMFYKFMDEKDKESIELGGKRQFFVREFENYSWSKLMDPRLGGIERMDLYTQALAKMYQNPHIAQLFRDIYKDAFIPFRSPETLNLFLKEIDQLDYTNTESLGDAFEYLLSVMGSQGDAGQFRTPRHIIDFMVGIVDPQKTDTILDPACGTAGFLISSYKHIFKQHDQREDPENKEIPLTPDERKQLTKNLVGYDISPDMVRLSKVNMYLHGFSNPTIFEYDTLSDETKWDESFDVILANPPFMSPKGGIKPHKRFFIQANRSEVLFVDYILEHLRPSGRAGIIVPEGIIFQSTNAYKALRKKLVEDGLYCVVSLPAGVFQPYSGIKTSILFFDKEISKRSKDILFVRIENDGFDLGSQRKPIEQNDIPNAIENIKAYKIFMLQEKINNSFIDFIKRNKEIGETILSTYDKYSIASKKIILASSDCNLTSDRYREQIFGKIQKWPQVELKEVLDYEQPTNYIVNSVDYNNSYKIPVLTAGKTFILGYTNEKKGIFEKDLPVIIFDDFTTATKFVDFPFKVKSSAMKILHAKRKRANIKFIFYIMQRIEFSSSTHKRYWISQYSRIKIPLPPLETQEQIVAELDGYQNIIAGVNQIVASWKPKINIDPEWKWLKVEDVAENGKNSIKAGPFGSSLKKETYVRDGYKIYGQEQVIKGDIDYGDYYIDKQTYKKLESCSVGKGDILISLVGTYGKLLIVPDIFQPGVINPRLMKITLDKEKCLPTYFKVIFESDNIKKQVKDMSYGGTMGILNTTILRRLRMPIPPLETQKQIVEKIEVERVLVESLKKLIEIYEQKTKDVVAKLWSE